MIYCYSLSMIAGRLPERSHLTPENPRRPPGTQRDKCLAGHLSRSQQTSRPRTSGPQGKDTAMKALTLDSFDSPPGLREDLPAPTPADNEVLVRVYASSVNPVDRAIVAGMMSSMVEHEFPVVLDRKSVV